MADTTKPTLIGITLPTTVNVATDETWVSFDMVAIDQDLPVDHATIEFDRSFVTSQGTTNTISFPGQSLVFRTNGEAYTSVLFKMFTAGGTYNVTRVTVVDHAGNTAIYDRAQVEALHSATSFTVAAPSAPDTTKPQLVSLTAPSAVSNYYTSSGEVAFDVAATDTGWGIDHVDITLDRPLKTYLGVSTNTLTISGTSGAFADGHESVSGYLPSSGAAGVYNITNVTVIDRAGNSNTYSSAQLQALGANTSFNAYTNHAVQFEITGFTMPSVIDVSHGGVDIKIGIRARTTSGAPLVGAEISIGAISSGDGGLYSQYNFVYLGEPSSPFVNGYAEATVHIGAVTRPGLQHIGRIDFDVSGGGNVASLTEADLQALGFNTTYTVIADTTKPVLIGLTIPSSVHLTNGLGSATITATAADAGTGVAYMSLLLDKDILSDAPGTQRNLLLGIGPVGAPGDSFDDGQSTRTVNFVTGYSQGSLQPVMTQDGVYTVVAVQLVDKAANAQTYTTAQLATMGINTTINISGGGPATTTPPVTTPPVTTPPVTTPPVMTLPTTTPAPATITYATAPAAVSNILRGSTSDGQMAVTANALANKLAAGVITSDQAMKEIIQAAGATTSVATLSYQFFTGKIPTGAGLDYLVSSTGPNANNLNSAYYQSFNLENRYINFAVNLGKNGEGQAAFTTGYGGLSLADATKKAYGVIFGAAPTDAKVAALLADGRDAYFASYGKDGLTGIGTKAAMVGWLLAEAQKADVGLYAHINDAFLGDLGDGATYAVDLVGVYGKPEYVLAA